ncbi:membrane-associated protein, putative [Bodo saltans]|uniref:Membrane-associated protein, putative n=1 Tax=Bodo saltans TaxID=75058 RepID=A0A0S4JG88_BODSA|nr:membrane-associated protein, putative [Bodo saltans]|eukprot:CUG89157.1 membrane-associated protein, putative [Bodo saltans]
MLKASLPLRVRVLVLTMIPSGGALTPALERLGYKPYTFKNTFQRGNAGTHPPEWASVLEGKKHFNLKLLTGDFDCLVGPPAAIAFDRVLRDCPAFTKVILVEEPDKDAWARDADQHLPQLLAATLKGSKRSVGKHFHTMVQMMLPSDKKLNRAAALEIFEERVKRAITADRLLVYRTSEGWEPLCEFLEKDVPEGVSFPPSDNGFEIFGVLEDRLRRAERLTLYVSIVMVAATVVMFWPFFGSIWASINEYYMDYKTAFATETETLRQEGREKDMSLRKAMVMSKDVTMAFEKKWRDEVIPPNDANATAAAAKKP